MKNSTEINGINALRFFAAFAIIIYHGTMNKFPMLPKKALQFFHNLPIGVDMFFLVSGFLIAYLLLKEKDKYQKINIKSFFVRRAIRIFPLYFLIVAIAIIQFKNFEPDIHFKSYLFFVANYWMIIVDRWTVAILNPLWSICIEEQFYWFIPFIIAYTKRQYLPYILLMLIFLCLVFRSFTTYNLQYNWMTIYVHLFSRCDALLIGALLAYGHLYKNKYLNISNMWFYAAIIILVINMFVFDNSDYTTQFNAVAKKYLFIIPLSIILICFINKTNKFIIYVSNNKIIYYLGSISFGLYMYHSIVFEYLNTHNTLKLSDLLIFTLGVILTILLSSISYYFYESKFLNLKKFFNRN